MAQESLPKDKQETSSEPYEIALLPLRDIIVFPTSVVPLFVGREKSIQALEYAMSTNKKIVLAAQKKAKINDPREEDIFQVGTLSTILQLLRLPDGTVKVLVEGQKRTKIKKFLKQEKYYLVETQDYHEAGNNSVENEALIRTVKTAFDNYVRLNKRIPPEMLMSISQVDNDSRLSDTLVSHLTNLKLAEKQDLLEQIEPGKRLEKIYGFIQAEIEIMRVEKKIRARVKRQMEKTQKEYYLNEQMAAIQKELGDKDDLRAEIQDMEKKLKTKKLSKEASERVKQEIRKLKMMSPMSAEATVVRNYVDTILNLPWGVYTKEHEDIQLAEEILDRDHFGLEKVKDRILEYLSVRQLVKEMKGPILCLVGPPGVGKTSLAKSVAESLNRSFIRISLGGVKDHADIRGHRKTYIGSMPGKIISSLRKATSSNPLMLLDEIEKMGMDHRGDPASALLEVLDPQQNSNFNDHYLDLDYDLSKCLFIATANSVDSIPGPLLDRMELIRIAGYTELEKIQIAKRYLIPRQLKENGMSEQGITFSEEGIVEVLRYYTKEAGVRNLEREISSVLRKVARKHIKNFAPEESSKKSGKTLKTSAKKKSSQKVDLAKKIKINEVLTAKSLNEYLGPRKYKIGVQGEKAEVGLCTGLAWTPVGGEILTTEVAILPGKGKLMITGKLGDVMQESAQAALSYVRSRAGFLGLPEDFYQHIDIHIHVPEGAIPKDGPSAGLCMATALTSALTQRPISQHVAMTGEITLSGRSLPIGGLKEKSLAAHRGGIRKVIMPKDNVKDLHEIPNNLQKELTFVPVTHMDEVLIHALVWDKSEKGKVKGKKDQLYQKLQKNLLQVAPKSPSLTH